MLLRYEELAIFTSDENKVVSLSKVPMNSVVFLLKTG
jgi:hypothetical protein